MKLRFLSKYLFIKSSRPWSSIKTAMKTQVLYKTTLKQTTGRQNYYHVDFKWYGSYRHCIVHAIT